MMTTKRIDIQTAVVRVLTTPLGSRVMRPLFGSRLHELIDRTYNESYRVDAVHFACEAIENAIGFVQIVKVEVFDGSLALTLRENEREERVDVRFAA